MIQHLALLWRERESLSDGAHRLAARAALTGFIARDEARRRIEEFGELVLADPACLAEHPEHLGEGHCVSSSHFATA
jgi:hypothetical protein